MRYFDSPRRVPQKPVSVGPPAGSVPPTASFRPVQPESQVSEQRYSWQVVRAQAARSKINGSQLPLRRWCVVLCCAVQSPPSLRRSRPVPTVPQMRSLGPPRIDRVAASNRTGPRHEEWQKNRQSPHTHWNQTESETDLSHLAPLNSFVFRKPRPKTETRLSTYLHFLYFFPLLQGHGSLRSCSS